MPEASWEGQRDPGMSQNRERSTVRIKTLSQNLQSKVDGKRKRKIPRLL